jgi:hypothetical protein
VVEKALGDLWDCVSHNVNNSRNQIDAG